MNHKIALGATVGEQVMQSIYQDVAKGRMMQGSVIILDFDGVEHVNGSFIKASALWLFICGQLFLTKHAQEFAPKNDADPRPYDIYPCVTGLSSDVQKEFEEFLKPRGIPLLFAHKLNDEEIVESVLIGSLDSVLRYTLKVVAQHPRVTAPGLHEEFPDQNVTVTAWNNRLNDLHVLRLVQRVRAGRAWEYQSLTKKILWE